MPRRLSPRRAAALLAATTAVLAALAVGSAAGYASSSEVEPIARDCEDSDLQPHTGFQIAPACVDTAFGEVSAQQNNPQLLIVDAPKQVRPGQDITLQVSTRNLIRDRFLGAGDGGYYLESSVLRDGIQRGHFHVACRSLESTSAAPAPDRNESFAAAEDGGGGRGADTVTVEVDGLDERGPAQCAAWAGDGSHRIPMMQFANQVPAFDAVRVEVRGAAVREESRPRPGQAHDH